MEKMNKYQEALDKLGNIELELYESILPFVYVVYKNEIEILQQAIDKANKFDKIFEVYDFTAPIDGDTAFNILNSLIDKNKELKQKANKYDEKETEKEVVIVDPTPLPNYLYYCPSCDKEVKQHYKYCPNCGQRLKWGDK